MIRFDLSSRGLCRRVGWPLVVKHRSPLQSARRMMYKMLSLICVAAIEIIRVNHALFAYKSVAPPSIYELGSSQAPRVPRYRAATAVIQSVMDIAAQTIRGGRPLSVSPFCLRQPSIAMDKKRAVPCKDSPSGTRGKSVAPARTCKLIFQGS